MSKVDMHTSQQPMSMGMLQNSIHVDYIPKADIDKLKPQLDTQWDDVLRTYQRHCHSQGKKQGDSRRQF